MADERRSSPFLFWVSCAWAASTCAQARRTRPAAVAAPPRWLLQLRAIGVGMETPSGAPAQFRPWVEYAARSASIPPRLLAALASLESAWNPGAVSSAGAIGLTQLMPRTARELGIDPWDPALNLLGGARYLRRQLDRFDDLGLALGAYNAGPERVEGYVRGSMYLPTETALYIQGVMQRIEALTSPH